MSFISMKFLLFSVVLLFAYFLVPKKGQWMVMLAANVVFYLSAGGGFPFFIGVTCVSSYACALLVDGTRERFKEIRANTCSTREEKQKNKAECTKIQKKIMAACLVLNFGIWAVLKYSGFPVFPLGISFYTFIAAGYCMDVYRGKYRAERNFAKFALFLSFFPHIVQGPFSRYDSLKETLCEPHDFSWDRLEEGAVRILWGIFKKVAIAGRLGIMADAIYGQQVPYEGVCILALMAAVSLQLYADFSGYMDIAVGISRIFGIRLEENFRQPFFSRSIEEFWHRWHITLGAWFRDYLFYSISMGKRVQELGRKCRERFGAAFARMLPSLIALFFVWTATGLWHGTAWNYLIWGWMNLFFIAGGILLAPVYAKVRKLLHIREDARWWQGFQMLRTFLLFGYMEMFSSASSAREALRLTAAMFRLNPAAVYALRGIPGLDAYDAGVILLGLGLMLAVDVGKEKKAGLRDMTGRLPLVVRYVGMVGLFYMILLLGDMGTDASKGFMYAQF